MSYARVCPRIAGGFGSLADRRDLPLLRHLPMRRQRRRRVGVGVGVGVGVTAGASSSTVASSFANARIDDSTRRPLSGARFY